MIQFTKTAMVSVLALGLITACGQNAAQDFDNTVVQPEQAELTAAEIAATTAQGINSPAFMTRTAQDGSVQGAFIDQRPMTADAAIAIANSGQVQWQPISAFSGDAEFALQAVNQQQGQFQQQQYNAGYNNNVNSTQSVFFRNGLRTFNVDPNVTYTRGQLASVVNNNILTARASSQFFNNRTYVSVPLVVRRSTAMIPLTSSFFSFSTSQSFSLNVVQNCIQNFGGIYVQSQCVQPVSLSLNTPWQLAVSCPLPVVTQTTQTTTTTTTTTGFQNQFPTTATSDSYLQVYL